MTNEFPRHPTGYNISKYTYGSFSLVNAGAYLTVTLAVGPGEVLGFGILLTTGQQALLSNSTIKFWIDGSNPVNTTFYLFSGPWYDYNFQSLINSYDKQNANYMAYSHRMKVPYDYYFAMQLINNGAGTLAGMIGIYYRHGD